MAGEQGWAPALPVEQQLKGRAARVGGGEVGCIYGTPWVLDRCVRISGFPGEIHQFAVCGLDHRRPTLLLTNQMRISAGKLFDRHARRMVIENAIAEVMTSSAWTRCPQWCR